LINVVEHYISAYNLEGPKILEETCRKHFGRSCDELQPNELLNIPLKMLKDGVSFDIVVETMAILYSTLVYMLNIVAPEEYGKLLTRRFIIEIYLSHGVENMSGLMSPFYRIKRQRYRDKTYYYLYKEWYDPEAKKKRSKLIGRCDELERLVVELEKLKQGVDNHCYLWCW